MNVLLAVPWDQEFGGVASVVGHLARHLSHSGHQVVFLHPGDPEGARTTTWGFPGYALNLRAPFIRERPLRSLAAFLVYLLPTLYRLRRIVRAHDIRIINVHYPVESFVVLGLLRWLTPFKLIVSVHGADILPDGQPKTRYGWSLPFLLSRADVVVAPSQEFRQDVARLFPRLEGSLVFIHNGVDLQELSGSVAPGAGVGPGRYLLCIAAFNAKKAIDVLLRAFARISHTVADLRLVLVGDGPLRSAHEALARSLGLAGRVQFLGERRRPEVVKLLRECELFVLPSRSEPFGIVVAEAMACGKPVVASAVGGIPEIVDDGVTGVLVAPDAPEELADALLSVLEDKARSEALARAGLERIVAHFSCEATGARYQHLYESLYRNRRAPGHGAR